MGGGGRTGVGHQGSGVGVGAGGDQTPSGRAPPPAGLHASSGAGARWGPWGSPPVRPGACPTLRPGRRGRRGSPGTGRASRAAPSAAARGPRGCARPRGARRRPAAGRRRPPRARGGRRRGRPRRARPRARARRGSRRTSPPRRRARSRAWLPRRRANRFALEPPARWRPWTRRLPTFDARSVAALEDPDRVAAEAHEDDADRALAPDVREQRRRVELVVARRARAASSGGNGGSQRTLAPSAAVKGDRALRDDRSRDAARGAPPSGRASARGAPAEGRRRSPPGTMPEAGVAGPARPRSCRSLRRCRTPARARCRARRRASRRAGPARPRRRCAGSPVPPRRAQVARSNWYLPRYWPSADTAAGLPPDSHCAMRWSVALADASGVLPADVDAAVSCDDAASLPDSPSAASRLRADDAVDGQAIAPLETADRGARARAEDAVGPHAERTLDRGDGHAAGRGARRPPLEGGDVSCASAPPAATALAITASVTPARPRSASRRRRAAAPRRVRDARSDRRHGRGELRSLSIPTEGFLRRLVAYGVSCRARAGRALRRALPAIRPRAAEAAQWVPRSPPHVRRGLGLGFNSSAAL